VSAGRSCAALIACIALLGAFVGEAAGRTPEDAVRHCHEVGFSERLRTIGAGCREARLVARRVVHHIDDGEGGWRVDAEVRGLHGRRWSCSGAGFNPLRVTCRQATRWIKLQIWAD
jgi:hypothetical protein